MPRLARIVVALLGLTAGCAASIEKTTTTFEKHAGSARPIVFLPGIKGSALADKDGATVFLTRSEVLGWSTPSLALPTRFRDGRQDGDGVTAVGVLRQLYVVPALMGEKIYGPWLDALAATGRPVYLFAYDWRRDNMETLRALEQTVHAVAKAHGQPVDVIGHSMGGMLAYALVTAESGAIGDDSAQADVFSPADVAALTLCGSPLRGGVGFLPDLHSGASTGLNDALLSPEVLATFPSIFSFFPRNAGADITPAVDFFDASSWRDAKLGPYADARSLPPTYDVFFVEALARASAFRSRVDAAPVREVPITVVASRASPTVANAFLKDGHYVFDQNKAPGDTRVLFERAMPNAPHQVVETKNDHASLLNDPEVIRAILPN